MSHQKNYGNWEPVIGLEIHAELNTKSKLFSSAPNCFGAEPNTNISVVCTGMPGALPVLNKEAVKKAVQFGCAIQGRVAHFSKFDRKSYFYPDSPRNFQITQFEEPIVLGGTVTIEVDGTERQIPINRVHLEDDAGTLKHFKGFAGVDYNRAGVPLIEIVSEPCIKSAQEASAYALAIKAILQYLDASDCNMEEGSLRFDVNVSVRKIGEQGLRNKIEIKNLNSFNFMELAIEKEIHRQIREYERHPEENYKEVIAQATYRWDAEKKETILMRRKETADDYRYFPEPDLVPIVLTEAYIEEIRKNLPELPYQREKRYVRELNLSLDHAFHIAYDKMTADFFDKALQKCANARSLCNWILVEFAGRLKESGKSLPETGILPEEIALLINMIDTGKITGKIAKSIADEMVLHPSQKIDEIMAANPDFTPLHDESEIGVLVDQVLAENQQSVQDFLQGRDRAFGFLVGQAMKLSRGKASPEIVNRLIKEKIKYLHQP